MVNIPTTAKNPIRILIAPKDNTDAVDIINRTEEALCSVALRRAVTKEQCLEFMKTFSPHLVIADYDFGVFPFINDVREKRPEIPFIIVSELELVQNAPTKGLNISVVKSDLTRIPRWIDALNAVGLLSENRADNMVQINCFLKATAKLPDPSDSKSSHPESPTRHAASSGDPLKKWTEEMEQRGGHTTTFKTKPSRPDPLLSAGV